MAEETLFSAIAVASETVYGTRPTMDPSATGIPLVNSPIPMPWNHEDIVLQPRRDDFQVSAPIPGIDTYRPDFSFFFHSSGTAGTTPRWMPLMLASGWLNTNTPATSDVMVLATDPTNAKSCTILNEYGGLVASATTRTTREANGVWGASRIFGNLTQGVQATFTGEGLWKQEVNGQAHTVISNGTAIDFGTTYEDTALISVTGEEGRLNNGGSDYKPCILSFEVATALVTERKLCMNAGSTGGLGKIIPVSFQPVLIVQFYQDPGSGAEITNPELQADIRAKTPHDIDWEWTDAAGLKMAFSFTGVPRTMTESQQGSLTVNTLVYTLAGANPGSITISA